MSEIFGRLGGPRDREGSDEAVAPGSADVSPAVARWTRRHLGGAVAALTTVVDGEYRASTVTGAMVASLEPYLVLISLEEGSQMEAWVRKSGVFAVSILTYQQQFLADQFAGMAPLATSRFHGIAHDTPATGSPVLSESIAWADCRVQGEIATGDHVCFLGQVVACGRGTGLYDDPLLSFQSRYRRLR